MASRKVFPAQEKQIIALYEAGLSQTQIAQQFGIDQTAVSAIVRSAGVSRGKKGHRVTAQPVQPVQAPATVPAEVLAWQAIVADPGVEPDVKLAALVKLKAFESQQYPQAPQYHRSFSGVPLDSDYLPDFFGDCSLDPATPKSAPAPPAPAKTWEPDEADASVIAWAERYLEEE